MKVLFAGAGHGYDFVKQTQPEQCRRLFDFEPVADNGVALWAMRARVLDGLRDWSAVDCGKTKMRGAG